ncbi:hypothetical protein ACIP79_28505 [Streptomyces sp. NPDC088747]|uniref:hypothetical protein n=1 Tax=Streptomyces sp. NPDC088747 TaxID=3365886 RepID=UPI0038209C46
MKKVDLVLQRASPVGSRRVQRAKLLNELLIQGVALGGGKGHQPIPEVHGSDALAVEIAADRGRGRVCRFGQRSRSESGDADVHELPKKKAAARKTATKSAKKAAVKKTVAKKTPRAAKRGA